MERKEAIILMLNLTTDWGSEACFEGLEALGVSREEFNEAYKEW